MASVQALFSPDVVKQAPFPSDRFTVPNPANITRLQVSLPLPDCTTHPSDCNDLRVVNTLDGFNVNPRLSIPFSGPIDVNTVSSDTVFLVNLRKGRHHGDRIGINQVVWDPAANALHAKSDQLLEQDTAYALFVTDGVHDMAGSPVQPSAAFTGLLRDDFDTSQAYLAKLSEALDKAFERGTRKRRSPRSHCGGEYLHHPECERDTREDSVADRSNYSGTRQLPARTWRHPDGLPACRHNEL
jgi:hypothetical protein